jgi:hypothetical protein
MPARTAAIFDVQNQYNQLEIKGKFCSVEGDFWPGFT